MNMEAKFSALKGYLDCEISSLNSKVDLFIESLKEKVTTATWKFFRKVFVFYRRISWQRAI